MSANNRYKNTVLNGVQIPEQKSASSMAHLEQFLEQEKTSNAAEPWSKLDKTTKLKKMISYAETYKEENQLTEEEYNKLISFFRDCLDRKRLYRVKDVVYDKEQGLIKSVPALYHNKQSNNFTLKNIEAKHVSTIKNVGQVKKTVGRSTAKNKQPIDDDDDNDEEDININNES
jgi:hypothetical protein